MILNKKSEAKNKKIFGITAKLRDTAKVNATLNKKGTLQGRQLEIYNQLPQQADLRSILEQVFVTTIILEPGEFK